MSRELALPDDGPLGAADAARTLAQLRAAREYVRSCPEGEALKAKRDAETLRHWARINKVASNIAIEACKLQATALRRLAQLGSAHIAGPSRVAAVWLGSLTDAEFDTVLSGMRYAKSPITLHKDWRRQEEEAAAYRRGREIAEGYGGGRRQHESLARAATDLLHAAMGDGATTVNELTEELAAALFCEISEPTERAYALRAGIESVVREALRSEDVSGESHPDFVTWKDREAGWLRIPWPAATLDQLRWMAEFRQEQARELQEAADTLAILVRDLDAIRADNPRMTRLNELWAALQAVLNAEDEADAA
jgi:hypothetical protein